ncbi:molybdate ABC transporter permease subunit [Mobilitalea sibirica]
MNWSPLWISLSVAIPATMITFFLGIFIAKKVISANAPVSKLLDVIFTLPLVLPPTVVGFLLLILFGKNGLIGRFLYSVGIQIVFTRLAAIIAAIVVSFPLMYRSAKAAFEQQDGNLIQAGRTLGLTKIQIFWRIEMPLAAPGILSGTILTFARALGEFGATLMIAGNIPKITQTMPMAIYMNIQRGETKIASVWVLLMIMLSFFMILFLNFINIKKEEKGIHNITS